MTDLAVIIVTWNVKDLALQALRSLYDDLNQSSLDALVYVVDSASADGTPQAIADAFPSVNLITSQENLGFARGNNAALRALGFEADTPPGNLPRAVYLLNPDTITQPGATQALFDALMAAPNRGIAGAALSYGDGSFQHSAFGFPGLRQLYAEFFPLPGRWREGRFNGRYPRRLYHGDQPFPVDFTLGATMMLRREVIQQTGVFDEAFFMYCEEIDWAWRIKRVGWHAVCVPAAHVVHLGGQSTGQASARSIINLWESRLYLYAKHHPTWKYWLSRYLVRLGMRRKLRHLAKAEQPSSEHLNAYLAVIEKART